MQHDARGVYVAETLRSEQFAAIRGNVAAGHGRDSQAGGHGQLDAVGRTAEIGYPVLDAAFAQSPPDVAKIDELKTMVDAYLMRSIAVAQGDAT